MSSSEWADLDQFVAQSVELLKASAAAEFIEYLSSLVDQVVNPDSPYTRQHLAAALGQILPFNSLLPAQILDVISQHWSDQSEETKGSLSAFLQTLISANIVTTQLAIELVDRNILQDSGIISNAQVLATRSVRINTGLLYKQQKFNLLREENEGYGKLSHEFNLALSELPKGGSMDVSEITTKSDELLTVVNALIGYFELDPNRVLDNILDVCSQNLLSHARFLLHFLHHSPWAPTIRASSTPFAHVSPVEKRQRLDALQNNFSGYYRAEMERPGGSRLAAQLLGFKLRYFASTADVNEKSQASPESLIFLIALLIKSGFIKLSDIYPYLSPSDNEAGAEFRKWKEDMDERAYMAKTNALALAGALGDDETGDGDKKESTEKSEQKVVDQPKTAEANQKVSLLHALLAVGCLPAAFQLLSLHPQISGPHECISDGIHRILHVAINSIYRPYSPSRSFEKHVIDGLDAQKRRAATSRTSTGVIDWLDDLERKSVRGYSPFPKQEYADLIVRFFLEDEVWTNDIPICETLEDFYHIAGNFLRFSGPRLGRDVSLLVKLARIGKGQFVDGGDSSVLVHRWTDLARLCLIPAISLVGANPGVVNEIYDLIRHFPYTTRFSLYGEWQTLYKLNPDLKLKASQTDKETKGILRRISKQDVKRFGRALAKTSTSNPLIVWAIAINQIENYDNFVEVVVDAAKFCTNLGYDVLEFVILSSLASPYKNRVKEDGTSIALWLTGLSAFCAKLFRRYAYMDVSTVTTYVACQLKNSNIYDLIVLRDLVTQMAGVLVRENLSDHQLRCYSGGDSLKEQAMSLLREPGTAGTLITWKKSSARLLKALTDTKLAGLLLVLIAQERETAVYNLKTEHTSNLKLLGNLFDECHGVLLQFHDFIITNMDLMSFEALLPSFKTIVKDFGVDPSVGFYLWRPILAEKVRQYDVDLAIQEQKKKLLEGLASGDKSTRQEDANGSSAAETTEVATVPASASESMQVEDEKVEKMTTVDPEVPWHPALRGFIEEAGHVLPSEVWNYMSPHFYTTFWQLSLYDISVPSTTYTQESQKLTAEIKKKDADRTDMSPLAVQRRRRERDRLQALIDQLNKDFKVQTAAYQTTKDRLSREKDYWFDWAKLSTAPEAVPPRNKTVLAILQHCIVPRSMFGPNEAIFCAKFVREMHRLGTKNFSSLTLFDKIFVNHPETVIFTCTNREAENYGRFLRELLTELTRWYADKATYDKEAVGPSTPGFLKKWNSNPSEAVYLQYEEFKSVMFKWHKYLTTAFKTCLESRDYMHVRNALAVLEKIINQYPQVDFHGATLEEKVNIIASKEETRGDLQIRAQGYLALLRKSSKTWVTVSKFSSLSKTTSSPVASSSPRHVTPQDSSSGPNSTSNMERQQSDRGRSSLNPAAPSFRPQDDHHRKPIGSPRREQESSSSRQNIESSSRGPAANSVHRNGGDERAVSSPRISGRNPTGDTRGESTRNRSESSRVEDPLRRSRSSREHDTDQRKSSATTSDRPSQAQDSADSRIPASQQNTRSHVTRDNQTKPVTKTVDPTISRDESRSHNNVVPEQSQMSRTGPVTSNQPRSAPVSRPRTPEGPRNTIDPSRDLVSPRGPALRDGQPSRSLRYDPRTNNGRTAPGFRAPPPTGPRASGPPPITVPSQNINTSRPPHLGRQVGSMSNAPVSRPSPPLDRSEQTSSSTGATIIINPERAARLSGSARDGQPDNRRSTSGTELRGSAISDTTATVSNRDVDQTSEVPRGPSDWRGRPKRDLQDEDPRRLSRGPDVWDNNKGTPESERSSRSDEKGRTTSARQHDAPKEGPGTRTRTPRDKEEQKDEHDHNDGARVSRESRQEHTRSETLEGRKGRIALRSDVNDREVTSRTREPASLNTRSEQARNVPAPLTRGASSTNIRETRDVPARDSKENLPVEKRPSHRDRTETSSRETRELASRDPKPAPPREDEPKRREERETQSRSKKDEPRELRHERARESHHGRTSSRRSPSRTLSDRGEKKDRERESERRSASRRETRDLEHRDKDRPARESEHRRETRERSTRDRETESRRGSRKHDRDKSDDGVDRGARVGDVGEGATGGDVVPSKRRRMER